MYTIEDFAKAFQKWEEEYRAEPTKFLTEEECQALGVSKLSTERAFTFMDFLEQIKG
jgi:hypothetical protein